MGGNTGLVTDGATRRATLSDWGLEGEVANALGERRVTSYTAPEQLDGETTPTTGTYQLGALTYRLLVDRVPFEDPADLAEVGDSPERDSLNDSDQSSQSRPWRVTHVESPMSSTGSELSGE